MKTNETLEILNTVTDALKKQVPMEFKQHSWYDDDEQKALVNCPNCDEAIEVGFHFCPYCGQSLKIN